MFQKTVLGFVLYFWIAMLPVFATTGGFALDPTQPICSGILELLTLKSMQGYRWELLSSILSKKSKKKLREAGLSEIQKIFSFPIDSHQFIELELTAEKLNELRTLVMNAYDSYRQLNTDTQKIPTLEFVKNWVDASGQEGDWDRLQALQNILTTDSIVSATVGELGKGHKALSLLARFGEVKDLEFIKAIMDQPIKFPGAAPWDSKLFEHFYRTQNPIALSFFKDGNLYNVKFKSYKDFKIQCRQAINTIVRRFVKVSYETKKKKIWNRGETKQRETSVQVVSGFKSIDPQLKTLLKANSEILEIILSSLKNTDEKLPEKFNLILNQP
jgi:hypothetical protein